MYVSIVLDTEYMGVAERNKWFLKSVSTAMKEDVIIVTHSYFKDHLKDVVDGCADRFYEEFEMERVSVEEIKQLDICYVPDEMFDSIYEKSGSRTKQLISLFNKREIAIEEIIISFIDEALKRRGESKPSFIMNCLHTFASVKHLAKYYDCPLIPYVFSAIRKVHGYSQTLYMAHMDENLFNSGACQRMYVAKNNDDLGFTILNKKEILSLLGKKHNMPLLPLINRQGCYEFGVVGEGFHITPEIYQEDSVTDDDLYYECKRVCREGKIITRQHPMQLDQAGLGRTHMKNDPAAFLLSCNRIVTVQSQMIMKAAMWNRAAVAMSNALPYACLLNKTIEGARPINDYDLNFILFVYFVPNACMFSEEYWKWRINNPQVSEIACKHLGVILSYIGLKQSDLKMIGEERNRVILRSRGFSDGMIDECLCDENISNVPYDYPTACLKCYMSDGKAISLFALIHQENDELTVSYDIPSGCIKCEFIPQNDLDGYITINYISIGKQCVSKTLKEEYYAKNQAVASFEIDGALEKNFEAKWKVRKYNS